MYLNKLFLYNNKREFIKTRIFSCTLTTKIYYHSVEKSCGSVYVLNIFLPQAFPIIKITEATHDINHEYSCVESQNPFTFPTEF